MTTPILPHLTLQAAVRLLWQGSSSTSDMVKCVQLSVCERGWDTWGSRVKAWWNTPREECKSIHLVVLRHPFTEADGAIKGQIWMVQLWEEGEWRNEEIWIRDGRREETGKAKVEGTEVGRKGKSSAIQERRKYGSKERWRMKRKRINKEKQR